MAVPHNWHDMVQYVLFDSLEPVGELSLRLLGKTDDKRYHMTAPISIAAGTSARSTGLKGLYGAGIEEALTQLRTAADKLPDQEYEFDGWRSLEEIYGPNPI